MPAALAVGIGLETTEGVLTDLIGDMLGDGVILTNHGVRRVLPRFYGHLT